MELTTHLFVIVRLRCPITCSSQLHHRSCNLIDLELVNKMRIPLMDINVTRDPVMGQELRAVGTIKQTVQCVQGD